MRVFVLIEKIGEPRKSKLRRINRKWGRTLKSFWRRSPSSFVNRATRLQGVLTRAGGKSGSGGKRGAGTDLGFGYLKAAAKTRQTLARAKKKGRTEKYKNKLRMAHTGNMNLSKHFAPKRKLP